jgi:hypothetical protein
MIVTDQKKCSESDQHQSEIEQLKRNNAENDQTRNDSAEQVCVDRERCCSNHECVRM